MKMTAVEIYELEQERMEALLFAAERSIANENANLEALLLAAERSIANHATNEGERLKALLRPHPGNVESFTAPRNVYSNRWRGSTWKTALPSALGSLSAIPNRRKLARALFELSVMFRQAGTATKMVLHFILLLILKSALGVEEVSSKLQKWFDGDSMPRPQPLLSRIPQAKPNAPNALI